MSRKVFLGVLAVALTLSFEAGAQTYRSRPPPEPGQLVIRMGDPCQRRSDNRLAVTRRDACGRWYCGRKDVPEVAQVDPGFAARMGCKWTVQADKRCICKRASFRVVPPQRARMSYRPG